MNTGLRELAARTPATRDRYVDFVRAVSILSVVIGHWLIGVLWWQDGVIRSTSAIGVTSWLWLATWFLQVMPLFFFVGGFSNLTSYGSARRKGQPTRTWIWLRAKRLLKPTAVFLGVWAAVQIGLHLLDVGAGTGFKLWGDTFLLRGMKPPGATIPFGPLWFLPVYLIVICLAPWMISLHRRFRWWVPAALVAGAFAVDWAAFAGGIDGIRYVNVLFVWLLPHQVGFFYGDGTLDRVSRTTFALVAVAGMAGLILLTNPPLFRLLGDHAIEWFGGLRSYPKSLLGTDIEPIANTFPPTIVMVASVVWMIGAAMLVRPFVTRWLQRPQPWMATIYVNSVIMTLYLWHMTAYLLAILLLWPRGFGRETDSTLRWWLERPLWILLPAVFLAGLVLVFGRFERPRSKPRPRAPEGIVAPAPNSRWRRG